MESRDMRFLTELTKFTGLRKEEEDDLSVCLRWREYDEYGALDFGFHLLVCPFDQLRKT